MLFFDIVYYQAYLFYANILKEDDPHSTTTWGVGAALSFIIIFNLLIVKEMFICQEIRTIYLFLCVLIIVWLCSIYFKRDNRRYRIVKNKVLYKNSRLISKVIAITYFGIAIAMMFIGPILGKYFHEINCK